MSRLYIPNSLALTNFEGIFKHNDFDFSDKNVGIEFHRKYVAMHPMAISFFAAWRDYFKENGIKQTGKIDKAIRSIPYLQRMGLFSGLGFTDPVEIKTHEESGRFIPLRKIKNGDELQEFTKEIDPLLHTDRGNAPVIKHVFGELLRNVIEHSGAKYGGNVCATFNRKKRKISIGISDAGIGIRRSISRSHRVSSDLDAIMKALTPGITGATKRIGGNEQNAGAGLFFTKSIAKSTRNYFIVYSGTGYYKLRQTPKRQPVLLLTNPEEDIHTSKSEVPFFPGTLIGIDVQIDDSKIFNNLLMEIGKAYRIGVKKSRHDFYKRIKFSP
jgi:anti-sigma regulatory factor (Ser/Thr protein kinase)